MKLTTDILRAIAPAGPKSIDAFVPHLNTTVAQYEINTPARAAAFLAQLAHESAGFRYTREIWGPTAAQRNYEGNRDLGNTQAGDGLYFRGRGLIQVTGRANYKAVGAALGLDLMRHPELLETPQYACLSAGHYWHSRALNAWADKGDFKTITKKINGGLNGYEDRVAYWERAKKALGV